MKLIMFAGPNGSGKSTLISDFLNKPKHRGLLYICPDAFFSLFCPDPPAGPDEYERGYIKAMELSESLRKLLINNGTDFIFETVFSTPEKVNFLRDAKRRGYTLSANFVTTRDPGINIERVAQRVREKGHDVPEEKIIRRYHRSMGQLPYLFELADELNIYDNSSSHYRLVYQHNASSFYFNHKLFAAAPWVRDYVIPYIPSPGAR
ncbi:MAG: zeta toxin family protein [Oscillospiraceae bacterium]|nr:zeta toxin family protein [Oscillospiraceae bacterium]